MMTEVNAVNARIVRSYLHYLCEAEGLSEKTVDNAARVIREYETFTRGKDFRKFQPNDASAFRRKLLANCGRRRAELSARSTVRTKLLAIAKFFRWLAGQPGYKSRIKFSDMAYFDLSLRDGRIATARREQPTPTLDQVLTVIRAMPSETDIQKRDRALMACMLLTGIRVGAVISLRLRHVRADRLGIDQDGADMQVKFGKTFTSYFFSVGDDIRSMFFDYLDHVRQNLGWGEDHPLFPRTWQGDAFGVKGLGDVAWGTPGPVWSLFKRAFAAVELSYFTPHSFRRTLAQAVLRVAQDPEMIKILSQNLGHESTLVTLTSYCSVPRQRHAERITTLDLTKATGSEAEALAELSKAIANPAIAKLIRKMQDGEG
jgi:integrase